MIAIATKFLGPTNHRGSRVRASDLDGNSVTVPYRHDLNSAENHREAARALCKKMNWTKPGTLWGGVTKTGTVWVFQDWEPTPYKLTLS